MDSLRHVRCSLGRRGRAREGKIDEDDEIERLDAQRENEEGREKVKEKENE